MGNTNSEHQNALTIIEKHGFTGLIDISGLSTIENKINPADHCGIYILRFSDDHYYIGQSVDIAKRFKEHTRTYDHYNIKIRQFSYKIIPQSELNDLERLMIKEFETHNIYLKNHTFSGVPKGESDLDMVWQKDEQDKWLDSYQQTPQYKERVEYSKQREKYRLKFEDLSKLEVYSEAINFLKEYFKYCVPEPFLTEFDFWRISCLPEKNCLCRLNIYQQEVLSLYFEDKTLDIDFHVTRSIPSFSELLDYSDIIQADNHYYPTGGADQCGIQIFDSTKAIDFINLPSMQKAIKDINIRLMLKGTGFNKPSHCVDLADKVLSGTD